MRTSLIRKYITIYYEIDNKLVREGADGRKFEYRLQEDGTKEILDQLL